MSNIPTDQIICGDCVEVMHRFPDECIDLCVTSPPYDSLRTYNGYTLDFEAIARQLYRITKPGGVVVWVVGDETKDGSESGTSFRQALGFMEIGFKLHDTMIWRKTSTPPQEQHPRYTPCFEYMLVFCKGYPPRAFNPIKEFSATGGQTRTTTGQRNADNSMRHPEGKQVVRKEMRNRWNVWDMTPQPTSGHPAPFPERLAEDHILSWSNAGDLVLDPMCGSGTTCKMAIKHHRRFIGIDISEEYCALARRRIGAVQPTLFDLEANHDR